MLVGAHAPRTNYRRRRRGRPPIVIPARMPARPRWDDTDDVHAYVRLVAALTGGRRAVRDVELLPPPDALELLTHRLRRRHADQLRRSRRIGCPRKSAAVLCRALKLLPAA